jgi:hypothetical protein
MSSRPLDPRIGPFDAGRRPPGHRVAVQPPTPGLIAGQMLADSLLGGRVASFGSPGPSRPPARRWSSVAGPSRAGSSSGWRHRVLCVVGFGGVQFDPLSLWSDRDPPVPGAGLADLLPPLVCREHFVDEPPGAGLPDLIRRTVAVAGVDGGP